MVDAFILPLVAGILTLAGLWLLLRRGWAQRLAMDVPNSRSLHRQPVPRIGGVVMIPLALLVAGAVSDNAPTVYLLAGFLCAVSFLDDRRGLPIVFRFACHVLAALALCVLQWPALSPLMLAVVVPLVVWSMNLYNFMDGSDGLAGGMALIGFSVLGVAALGPAPAWAGLAFCLAAAAAGFLVFNFVPARVFMGDAGSVPLGFLAAAFGVAGGAGGLWPAWFVPLVFSPFVVDASATLLRRLWRRERFWQAHREHYYQRLVRLGWGHRRVALAEYGLMGAAGLSALELRDMAPVAQWLGVAGWLIGYGVLMTTIDRLWARTSSQEIAR